MTSDFAFAPDPGLSPPRGRHCLPGAVVLGVFLLATLCGVARGQDPPAPRRSDARRLADELLARGAIAEAIPAYERTVEVDPADGGAWFFLGYARHLAGDYHGAVAAYEEGLGQGAPPAATHYNVACSLALAGDAEAALEALERAAGAGYSDHAHLLADPDLAPLRAMAQFAGIAARIEFPVRRHPGHDAIDFWLGDWTVHDPSGRRLGTNRITRLMKGFAVREEWTDSAGGRGTSLFVFEAAAGTWEQLWVSDTGWIVRKTGLSDGEGGMIFEGDSIFPDGRRLRARTLLAPQPDGTVVQRISLSDDGSATWKEGFVGIYRRTEVPEAAPREAGADGSEAAVPRDPGS